MGEALRRAPCLSGGGERGNMPAFVTGNPAKGEAVGGGAARSVCKEIYTCAPPTTRGGSLSSKGNTEPFPVTRRPRLG